MGRGVVERRHTDERVSDFSMQVLECWILCSLSCERGEEFRCAGGWKADLWSGYYVDTSYIARYGTSGSEM